MIVAKPQDKSLVVDILAQSFDDNLSVNYVVRQDSRRQERIRSLMSYSFEYCQLFGKVWLSEDRTACALVLYPERKKSNLQTTLLDLKLAFGIGLSHVGRVLAREKQIKALHPATPFCHLWFIGTRAEAQGKGTGSRLLAEVVADSRLPIYLETSVDRNIPWYEKNGFTVFGELAFPAVRGQEYRLRLLRNRE